METLGRRATGATRGRVTHLRPASGLGYGRAKRSGVSFAGIELDLAPWESLVLPEPIAEDIEERTDGGLNHTLKVSLGGRRIFPYQIRARITCP